MNIPQPKKLTKAHRTYLQNMVDAIWNKETFKMSQKLNATLHQHGMVSSELAATVTPEGLRWLGKNEVHVAAVMILQYSRKGDAVRLTEDVWVAVAQRYYALATLWEMRCCTALIAAR